MGEELSFELLTKMFSSVETSAPESNIRRVMWKEKGFCRRL